MIIYLPLEILPREIHGHLLLGIVAASRGHQVIIFSPNDVWLYFRMKALPKGVYLLKNLNIPDISNKMYNRFLDKGFDLYCQEQEPPILNECFAKYLANGGISIGQVMPFKAVFCYGERDMVEYNNFFLGKHEDTFFNTGSPRIDIWSAKFKRLHIKEEQKKISPYFLVVSNFGRLMGKKHFSKTMLDYHSLDLFNTFQQQEAYMKSFEEETAIGLDMMLAIKKIALMKPDIKFVIKSHPVDEDNYWRDVFSDVSNVKIVEGIELITPWISNACAVIQNGCTSAIEASIQGLPVVSYGADRQQGNIGIPNKLGFRVRTVEELDSLLMKIINKDYNDREMKESHKVLSAVINMTGDAAYKIVGIMERKSNFSKEIKIRKADLLRMSLLRKSKNAIDALRRAMKQDVVNSDNYCFDYKEISGEVQMISNIIGVDMPKIDLIGKTGLYLSEL